MMMCLIFSLQARLVYIVLVRMFSGDLRHICFSDSVPVLVKTHFYSSLFQAMFLDQFIVVY